MVNSFLILFTCLSLFETLFTTFKLFYYITIFYNYDVILHYTIFYNFFSYSTDIFLLLIFLFV